MTDFSIEKKLLDVEAVVENAGLERFAVIGSIRGRADGDHVRRAEPGARQSPDLARYVRRQPDAGRLPRSRS